MTHWRRKILNDHCEEMFLRYSSIFLYSTSRLFFSTCFLSDGMSLHRFAWMFRSNASRHQKHSALAMLLIEILPSRFMSRVCAVVSEWLRRLTRNQLGSARIGSSPIHGDSYWKYFATCWYEVSRLLLKLAACRNYLFVWHAWKLPFCAYPKFKDSRRHIFFRVRIPRFVSKPESFNKPRNPGILFEKKFQPPSSSSSLPIIVFVIFQVLFWWKMFQKNSERKFNVIIVITLSWERKLALEL